MLLLAALVLVLNVTTTLRVTPVSSIDEAYWIDHMLRGRLRYRARRCPDPPGDGA